MKLHWICSVSSKHGTLTLSDSCTLDSPVMLRLKGAPTFHTQYSPSLCCSGTAVGACVPGRGGRVGTGGAISAKVFQNKMKLNIFIKNTHTFFTECISHLPATHLLQSDTYHIFHEFLAKVHKKLFIQKVIRVFTIFKDPICHCLTHNPSICKLLSENLSQKNVMFHSICRSCYMKDPVVFLRLYKLFSFYDKQQLEVWFFKISFLQNTHNRSHILTWKSVF